MPGPHDSSTPAGPRTLGVIGVGLIGGSVALAARRRIEGCRVIGLGRSRGRLMPAVEAGVLDDATDRPEALADADLVIACTPVDRIVEDLAAVAPHLREDAVLTDAGSTKRVICSGSAVLHRPGRFVGSHPMAGSEKTGWQNADADLFEDRVCVVTPTSACDQDAVAAVGSFWCRLGGRVVGDLTPDAHDRLVARVSHMPHFAAAAVATGAGDDFRLAAGGFRDTTRVAAGDPDLWAAIAEANAGPLSESLAQLEHDVRTARLAIDNADWDAVRSFLALAAQRRRAAGEVS